MSFSVIISILFFYETQYKRKHSYTRVYTQSLTSMNTHVHPILISIYEGPSRTTNLEIDAVDWHAAYRITPLNLIMNPEKYKHSCHVENLNLNGCVPQETHVIILFYLVTFLLIMSILMFFFSILMFSIAKHGHICY